MKPNLRRRQADISRDLGASSLPELLQRLYAARGVTSQQQLDLQLKRLLPPQQLKGLAEAAQLLADAVEFEAQVLIVGDFDADGATSSALAVSVLRQFGLASVSYLVPNRFEFGYGLSPEIVGVAATREPDLIVTVDNGISSLDGVAAAQALGISVLITDHHLPGDSLPEADVIVNPNQPGCLFPSKCLAGVGVMFYVLSGVRAELRAREWFASQGIEEPNLADALDLVALGTVADVVPLDDNNRRLVAAGLDRIRSGRARPGIEALFEVAGRDIRRASASDLGFIAGPRLNAAGRLDDMSLGVECLLAESTAEARGAAERLDRLNRERRDIEQSMQHDAQLQLRELQFDARSAPFGLALFDPTWHQGVVGILASRLKEQLYRPVIIFADAGQGELKGSGRSISGVHLRDVLAMVDAAHPELILRFGGHAMAAGLTIAQANFERFARIFNEAVSKWLSGAVPEWLAETDGELSSSDLSLAMARTLRSSGPWGQQFPEPSFDGEFEVVNHRIVGERHLKLRLSLSGQEFDAIAFNIDPDEWLAAPLKKLACVYQLDVNEYNGRESLQLLIQTYWDPQEA
jgi:single-stranded-DNA-specific exonuclease